MNLPARMLKICEAQLEGQPISEHDRAWLENKIHPKQDHADELAVLDARDRRLCAMKMSVRSGPARAKAIIKQHTDYRTGAWRDERSMIEPPERHREMWELMRLTAFIPGESRLRRILAAGSRRSQKKGL